VAYPLAGSFVADLIAVDGLPRLAAFFRACPDPAGTPRAFRRVYGRSLEEAVAGWRARLGVPREELPSAGNADRIASAQGTPDGPRDSLAQLALAATGAPGTDPAVRRGEWRTR
jgi:hypothetical protein